MSTNELWPKEAIENRIGFEQWTIERATLFSTVKFLGRGKKDRKDWNTLAEAVAYARPDPQVMVYASMASGRSAMIAPKDYDQALTVVGREA